MNGLWGAAICALNNQVTSDLLLLLKCKTLWKKVLLFVVNLCHKNVQNEPYVAGKSIIHCHLFLLPNLLLLDIQCYHLDYVIG